METALPLGRGRLTFGGVHLAEALDLVFASPLLRGLDLQREYVPEIRRLTRTLRWPNPRPHRPRPPTVRLRRKLKRKAQRRARRATRLHLK